jgi:hypothetical protein
MKSIQAHELLIRRQLGRAATWAIYLTLAAAAAAATAAYIYAVTIAAMYAATFAARFAHAWHGLFTGSTHGLAPTSPDQPHPPDAASFTDGTTRSAPPPDQSHSPDRAASSTGAHHVLLSSDAGPAPTGSDAVPDGAAAQMAHNNFRRLASQAAEPAAVAPRTLEVTDTRAERTDAPAVAAEPVQSPPDHAASLTDGTTGHVPRRHATSAKKSRAQKAAAKRAARAARDARPPDPASDIDAAFATFVAFADPTAPAPDDSDDFHLQRQPRPRDYRWWMLQFEVMPKAVPDMIATLADVLTQPDYEPTPANLACFHALSRMMERPKVRSAYGEAFAKLYTDACAALSAPTPCAPPRPTSSGSPDACVGHAVE